jgi:hypothetical protein
MTVRFVSGHELQSGRNGFNKKIGLQPRKTFPAGAEALSFAAQERHD